MSHNTVSLIPYISSHTSTVSEAGVQNILITGFGLSPATSVAIDSNLGTLVSRSYAKASATSGTITLSVNVSAPPSGSSVNRTLTVSHGGYPVQGTGVTGSGVLTVQHGFSPTNIASLQAWFDAADASSITKDASDLVSQWSDKSGNGHHATQSTGANQPKYFASGGGIGQKHIRWGLGGNWHYLDTATSVNWLKVAASTKVNASFFVVFNWPGAGGSTWGSNILRTNTANVSVDDDSQGTTMWHNNGRRCEGGTASTSLPDKVLGGWLWTDTHWVTRVNGAVDDSQSGASTTARTETFRLGGSSAGSWTDFEISEILVFNTELTGTDLSSVESYLNTKWDIY